LLLKSYRVGDFTHVCLFALSTALAVLKILCKGCKASYFNLLAGLQLTCPHGPLCGESGDET